MKRLWWLCAVGCASIVGAARAQTMIDAQPITNLQNGISPKVAAVRREQDDRALAVARLNKAATGEAIAVRGRLSEHDCQGARNLAAQGRDLTLSAEVETLCAPPVNTNAPPPQGLGPR